MRYQSTACVLSVCLIAAPVWAQAPADQQMVAPPSWAFNDLACAPGLAPVKTVETAPPPAYRVIGSQDTVIRSLLGPGDTLVISGGSNAGLQSGQRYFVRRLVQSRAGSQTLP